MGIAKAIMGTDQDRLNYIDRETLLSAVRRQIFCEQSGDVLDISTAVLLIVGHSAGQVSTVWTSEAWDSVGRDRAAMVRERFPDFTLDVIDGRRFTARGDSRKRPFKGWSPGQVDIP